MEDPLAAFPTPWKCAACVVDLDDKSCGIAEIPSLSKYPFKPRYELFCTDCGEDRADSYCACTEESLKLYTERERCNVEGCKHYAAVLEIKCSRHIRRGKECLWCYRRAPYGEDYCGYDCQHNSKLNKGADCLHFQCYQCKKFARMFLPTVRKHICFCGDACADDYTSTTLEYQCEYCGFLRTNRRDCDWCISTSQCPKCLKEKKEGELCKACQPPTRRLRSPKKDESKEPSDKAVDKLGKQFKGLEFLKRAGMAVGDIQPEHLEGKSSDAPPLVTSDRGLLHWTTASYQSEPRNYFCVPQLPAAYDGAPAPFARLVKVPREPATFEGDLAFVDEASFVKPELITQDLHPAAAHDQDYKVPRHLVEWAAARSCDSPVPLLREIGEEEEKEEKKEKKKEEDENEEESCRICFEAKINSVFVPCGHLACCYPCATPLGKCPICRGEVKQVVKTFKS